MKLKMKLGFDGIPNETVSIKVLGIENEDGEVMFRVEQRIGYAHRISYVYYEDLVFSSEEQETEFIMEFELEEKLCISQS